MKGIARKAATTVFVLAVCVGLFSGYVHAFGPGDDTMKEWLSGQEIKVGSTFFFFDETTRIRFDNIKDIRLVEYKEKGDGNPFTNDTGTAVADFTYTYKGRDFKYRAVFGYHWDYGIPSKKRYLQTAIVVTQ